VKKKVLKIKNRISELQKINSSIEDLVYKWNIPQHVSFNINLVIEEVFSNIVFYGYQDDDEHEIFITYLNKGDRISVEIVDDAKEFNPLLAPSMGVFCNTVDETEVGGIGLHLIKCMVDDIDYARRAERNILTVEKMI